jgi:hypothetical protein
MSFSESSIQDAQAAGMHLYGCARPRQRLAKIAELLRAKPKAFPVKHLV